MATREENFKEINAQLELMSDDELDQIAGGDCYEMADDSRFLNSLNGSCDRYGATRIWFSMGWTGINDEIEKAWATVGIEAHVKSGSSYKKDRNTYKLDGKQITQEEARQHAMKVTGHYMERKDWNW